MRKNEYSDVNNDRRNRENCYAVPFLCFAVRMLVWLMVWGMTLMICGCSNKSAELIPISEDSQLENTLLGSDGNEATLEEAVVEKSLDKNVSYDQNYNSAPTLKICFVHVCGAVNNPGVYELDGSRHIVDAINAAGGFSSEAAEDYINLATELSDGMKVYVPTTSEAAESNSTSENNGSAKSINAVSVGEDSDYVDCQNVDSNEVGKNASSNGSGLININIADVQTLTTLPGIGQAKAMKIIDYRENNGAFRNISDIMNVDGIKNGMYDKIKDRICVD